MIRTLNFSCCCFLGTNLSLYRFWFSYNIFVFIICRCSSFSLLHTHFSRSPLPKNYGITDWGRKSGRGNYHESGKLLWLSSKTSTMQKLQLYWCPHPRTLWPFTHLNSLIFFFYASANPANFVTPSEKWCFLRRSLVTRAENQRWGCQPKQEESIISSSLQQNAVALPVKWRAPSWFLFVLAWRVFVLAWKHDNLWETWCHYSFMLSTT